MQDAAIEWTRPFLSLLGSLIHGAVLFWSALAEGEAGESNEGRVGTWSTDALTPRFAFVKADSIDWYCKPTSEGRSSRSERPSRNWLRSVFLLRLLFLGF